MIPRGEYGAGTVMVWDIGTYEVIEGNYWKGRLSVFLNGKKLKGEWSLQRIESGGRRENKMATTEDSWQRQISIGQARRHFGLERAHAGENRW